MEIGIWRTRDFEPGEGLRVGAHARRHDEQDWLAIDVPGDVHRALIGAGRIPDPFYGTQETDCAWVEEREWWYRTRIEAPPDGARQRLTFHGLDTFATIYLNGQQIGEHANMFKAAALDITLEGGSNTLAVRFDPPLEGIRGKTLSAWGPNPERSAMRKAQFGYGWDWGPRLPTVGIWRSVDLRPWRATRLGGVHFSTLELRDQRAAVAVRLELEGEIAGAAFVARVELTPPGDGPRVTVEAALESVDRTVYLTVDDVQPWWTHELGPPALYHLSVKLVQDAQVVDEYEQDVGIRTLELDQSPDPAERGTRFFRFVLNGVPIFAKGADWIPCDSFVGDIPVERYTRLLEMARDANMTMLRVWGGGIYEHDAFYAECDRLGILVWQDFMFACAMYPEDDPGFISEVEAEARYQVRRLRNHPCLALWCGNNENQWLHERSNWNAATLPPYGALFYDSILPRAVRENDGRTPYWPGSPYGGDDHNSREEGNVHNWEVWHGNYPRRFGEQPRRENTPSAVSYRRYAEDLGRFISEFGMHAAPAAETLWRVVPPDQRYMHSPTLDWHNKDNPKNKGDNLLLASTGLPVDLEQYITYSQMAQAEGLKFGVEHFRRRKPHCSGTLVWQFDDCWPVLSWSIVDYFCVPKAGYYFLKRAYAPVLASFKEGDGGLELWLTNDHASAVADRISITFGAFSGETMWQISRDVAVAAGESVCVWRADDLHRSPSHYIHVRSHTDIFPANRYFFGEYKDLQREPTAPQVHVTKLTSHELRVRLQAPASSYVYFAHVTAAHETTRMSDNYIDLTPGEERELAVIDRDRELNPEHLSFGWA